MRGSANTVRAICEMTVSSWPASTAYKEASPLVPRNMAVSRIAIHISVVAAFCDSGGRNADTPLEIASTPVRAVQPLAKALRRRSRLSGLSAKPSACLAASAPAIGG